MAKLKILAAICDEPGEGDVLNLRHVMIDEPHEMEVRVKIETTGICRSDIHYLRGVWVHPKPVILGHEACGHIESVGAGVPKSPVYVQAPRANPEHPGSQPEPCAANSPGRR